MAADLDALDLKILTHLLRDGRAPAQQVADAVGLSRPAVADRIGRLERDGVIRGITVVVEPTALGRAVCDPWPEQVYQWHREGFDLPAGAELLAEGDTFPVQAFRQDSAYALQFHPDVTHAMMCRWTARGHDRMLLPNAKPRPAHFADRAVHDPAGRAWLAAFLNHWLAAAG